MLDRSSTSTRLLILLLAITALAMMLLACEDPQCKAYHISIEETATGQKSQLYCDGYNWLSNRTALELISCSGHGGTVTENITAGDKVVIENFTCIE